MTTLNINSRLLRSGPDGFYNQGMRSEICQSCGIQEQCRLPKTAKVCSEFSPVLTFRPPLIGLDGWSNTFRLSPLWFGRLKDHVGKRVSYYDVKGPTLIGHAKLVGVAQGTMNEMLERYAWSNHLCLGAGISKADAPDWLREKLIRNYKTMFKKEDGQDTMAVIFSVRLRNANTKEDSKGLHGSVAAKDVRTA